MKDRSRRNIPFDYIERVGQTQLTDWAVIGTVTFFVGH
jgi:hypothetical protein